MHLHFQVCSNSAYPQHSGERYRTNGPLVTIFLGGNFGLPIYAVLRCFENQGEVTYT